MAYQTHNGVFGPGGNGGGIFQTSLGALVYDTKQGIFGPGGNGGGIFQTTVQGVGLEPPAPMSTNTKLFVTGCALLAIGWYLSSEMAK